MYTGKDLKFYGGTIKSTGSQIMTSIIFDGVAFGFYNKLVIPQGINPVVKCGETESDATEMATPIADNAFTYGNKSNTYHYASISAADYREPVSYINALGNGATCSSYNIVTSNTTEWSNGWYVVNKNTTISQKKTSNDGVVNIASGADVNLILCDGVKLTITDNNMNSTSFHPGIKLPVGATLNIFGQGATNPGELDVSYGGDGKSKQFYQINGGDSNKGGSIVVNGGKLTANGGSHILNLTSLTVNDGIVNAINGTTYAIFSSTIIITNGEINGSTTSNASAISGAEGIIVNGGRLVGISKSGEFGGIGGTITLGDGMYLYGGENEGNW